MKANEKLQDPNREENSNNPENSSNINTYPQEIISSEDNILPEAAANKTNEQLSNTNLPTGQAGAQFSTEQEMEVQHHTHPMHGKKILKTYSWAFLNKEYHLN